VVVIIIRNKDGTETKIQVPDGATVEVQNDGKTVAKVPGDPKQPVIEADRKAATWVLTAGGTVYVDGQKPINSVAALPKEPFALTHVFLHHCGAITDAGLAHLSGCKSLVVLHLWSTPVTDAGMVHFAGCKSLSELHLGGTGVTDAGLKNFTGCENLTLLSLANAKVGDVGVAYFSKCAKLNHLNLDLTGVTDAGLAQLHGLKGLTELWVRATKVTPKGLADFHAAVPGCKIEWDGGTIEPKKASSP
jgi:hypothetical protein